MNSSAKPAFTSRQGNEAVLTLIKAVHTLAWLSIESCMMYVLYAGLARRTDRRAAMAGTVVAGETLIFAANGFRCPLTKLAENYGAADGSVTDIWLPRWLAHNLPALHVPLVAAAAYLNGRNLHQRNPITVTHGQPIPGQRHGRQKWRSWCGHEHVGSHSYARRGGGD